MNGDDISPAGSPACPYCENQVAPDGLPFGLATCAQCGASVWFLTVGSEISFFRYEAASLVRTLFDGLIDEQKRPEPMRFDGVDDLELVMGFEAALEEAMSQ